MSDFQGATTPANPAQIDLFEDVLGAYAKTDGELSSADLYRRVGASAGIDDEAWEQRVPIGKAGQEHSPLRRKVRWYQQTLKQLGLIERGEVRGRWRLTAKGRKHLTPAAPKRVLVAFSTRLGLALWASASDVFSHLGEPIHLCLTSPPYPLATPRAYGNVSQSEWVDWLCKQLEPIVRNLAPGGSIVLNVSNDIFIPGTPARSTYQERMVIALEDRFGLYKMDMRPWVNPSKPPGPIQWASKQRIHLNTGYEPIYWFARDPLLVGADNRRVLQPHTEKHLKLIRQGGERRQRVNSDGAYRLYNGSYGNETPGRIPRNVIVSGSRCADQRAAREHARQHGLAEHGATMPLRVARQIVEHIAAPGQLMVDPFAGWMTSARAAELAGVRWIATERMGEYALSGAQRFRDCDGFEQFGQVLTS